MGEQGLHGGRLPHQQVHLHVPVEGVVGQVRAPNQGDVVDHDALGGNAARISG
jgi:hypothetical protein